MIISFYGEGCFKIQSGETNILIDPINPESGLSSPRFKFDILLKTINLTDNQKAQKEAEGRPIIPIINAGEYNIKGIDIAGLNLTKESSEKFLKTIYLVAAEAVKLCFLGHLSEMPEPDIAESLEEIDILFVPAGGQPFISQNLAAKLIKQIGPKIVIPSFFKIPGLKRPTGDLKLFLEEIGLPKTEPQEKLTIKKKDLEEIKKTQIIVLKT